ncbi:MAG: peptidase T [Rikenellaceae bacterium]
METIESRFLRYTKIDTQSSDSSASAPSTDKQFDLLNMLSDELQNMGIDEITMSEQGYLYATLLSNTKKPTPSIGFIAHVDTSPDMSGRGVNAQIIRYDGGDIVLNSKLNIVTFQNDFPELSKYVGHDLIVTDGTTLLGADDKAGVAEIISAIEYLIEHPEIEHGKICIAFTSDEEIGRGADHFDVRLFGADFAYTIDGSSLGELEYENFNAASVVVDIQGRNVHPGYAKDKMINAFSVAMEIDSLLPKRERPQYTADKEGFYHLVNIKGSVDAAQMEYIVRDHSDEIYHKRVESFKEIAQAMCEKYGEDRVKLTVKEQYRNMRSVIENGNMAVVDRAIKAMRKINITPVIKPIRGGTDGSRLSFMGLPTPNLFAGGENIQGRHEIVSVKVMNKSMEMKVEI